MKRGVIFDMDGVLIDNRDVHIEAFVALAKIHNIELSMDTMISHFGKSNSEIFPAIFPNIDFTPELINTLNIEKEEIYRRLYTDVQPVAGLIEMIDYLKSCGIKLAVGSSGPRKNIDFILQKCGISDKFDVIVDGNSVTRAKPDPEIFLVAAQGLGTSPAETLVFEDSFAGIEAAHRAGMECVVLATTFARDKHKQDQHIGVDFTEIMPIIDSIIK